MIPTSIHGNPVRSFAVIEDPQFPRDYPGDGDLEPTAAFTISTSDEGSDDAERFWVSCVAASGRMMAGDVFYSLDDAKGFPYSEFDLPHFDWRELGAHNQ